MRITIEGIFETTTDTRTLTIIGTNINKATGGISRVWEDSTA